MRKPGIWSGELKTRLADYRADRQIAYYAGIVEHGPREALAMFLNVLDAYRPLPGAADIKRVAGLVLSGVGISRIRGLRRGR